MGSDSPTADSSKPRPKWRNKHLDQLNNDQLQEVQAHRGDDSYDLLEATQPLQQQAGPEPSSARSDHSPGGSASRSGDRFDSRDKSKKNNRRDHQLPVQGADHLQDSWSEQTESRHNHPQRRNERDDQRRVSRAGRLEEQDARTGRAEPRHSKDRHELRDHAVRGADQRQPDRAQHQIPEQQSAQSEKKQESVFRKLLNFKVSRPVKWGLMALAIACLVAVSFMKPIDNSSQSQLDSALTRALIGFGLARTLNGVISVAQGTEFAVQPAGVGVNFSPGEILDPINDLVERFSWVMLLATSSLGVQKILLEVSSWVGISLLLGGAGLFFLLTRLRNSAVASLADFAGKLLLLMLLVRFLIPLGSLANDWVYHKFLEPRFEQSSEQLEIASNRIREISTRQTQAEESSGSLSDRAKNLYNSVTSRFDFDGMLDDYKQSAENVSEHAVNLIVVFMLQTIIFPLLFLYLIYRLFRSLLEPPRAR